MPLIPRTFSAPSTAIPGLAAILAGALLLGPSPASGQALDLRELPGGTLLLTVVQPEAAVTAVAWPELAQDGSWAVRSLTAGELTLSREVASALGGEGPAPPAVVGVGAAPPASLATALSLALGGRQAAPFRRPDPPVLAEGTVERRLGPPGSEATLTLRVPLPPLTDPRRTPVELLLELAPELLSRVTPGLRPGHGPGWVALETTVDADLASLVLSRLRRELAQLADAPGLDGAAVERARSRLAVGRRGLLEQYPGGAEELVRLWMEGGEDAIRQWLFGPDGATLEAVRRAAATWLSRHPGQAVLRLPPQALNPRFARGPRQEVLENNLSVAVLERPGASLTAVCLRPVVIPDLDGARAATVLTRLAGVIRTSPGAPGWIRVEVDPPRLELAGPPDGLDGLLEVLASGLAALSGDTTPLPRARDARATALELAGALLGVEEEALTPAALLAPANLALGIVAPDHEAALETLGKLLGDLPAGGGGPEGREVTVAPRRRAAVPGRSSAVAVILPLGSEPGPAAEAVAAALLAHRARRLPGGLRVEILAPPVPGRRVLVALASGEGTVDQVEASFLDSWEEFAGPPREEELEPLRPVVATRLARDVSGALGGARRCAALAAVGGRWQTGAELERAALGLTVEEVAPVLAAWADVEALERTGAGPLPVDELPRPAR